MSTQAQLRFFCLNRRKKDTDELNLCQVLVIRVHIAYDKAAVISL